MAIKVGFSSMVCPSWDFKTMVGQAAEMGFDGIELRGLNGRFHLPDVPELADDPSTPIALLKEAGVQLVCLGSSAAFESPDRKALEQSRRALIETIDLAARLECPSVRIFLGDMVGAEHRGTLGRVAAELARIAPQAMAHRTSILVENGGDFVTSQDLWFIIDAVAHPAVRACWNPLNARFKGERPTRSVPRLVSKMSIFRLADGNFDEQGRFLGYEVPGSGDVELERAVSLLKGVCYQGWLMFEWPKMIATLPEPEVILPKVNEFARRCLADSQPLLSAYKGDKNPAKFEAPSAVHSTASS